MVEYLIVCPLMFLGGFVDAIAGGGGIITLPAYIIAGIPAHVAIGTNKLASSMGTAVSTGRYLKKGYLSGKGTVKYAIAACIMSLIGSNLGARMSLFVDEIWLKNLMIFVLPLIAVFVLKEKKPGTEGKTAEFNNSKAICLLLISAFLIGGYDGFYGPGAGTFLLILMTGVIHMEVRQASAMTKVINLSSNVSALVTYLIGDAVYARLGLTAGFFCIAGHYIGSGLVISNGQKIVRPIIITVMVMLFVKILTDL